MITIKRLASVGALLLTLASLVACVADPDRGMPYSYTTLGAAPLTAEKVGYQDTVVIPRCGMLAKQTVPSQWRAGSAYAANHFVAGIVGGAGGAASSETFEYAALHVAMGPGVLAAVVGASALNAGIQSAAQAYASGAESSNLRRHATIQGCATNDAVGIHQVPPSIGQEIKSGKRPPQSFAAPWQGGESSPPPPVPAAGS